MFNIDFFNPEWQLNELIANNPAIWMVQINGIIVDIRTMSSEIQQQAFDMGIIPYIPEKRIENNRQVSETGVHVEKKNDQKKQTKRQEESKEQLNFDS